MGSTEEPERKRRHLNHSSISPALKKQASLPSADDKKVDAAMLQYQNQKLEQQLDVQRSEIDALESKFSQLKNKQASHESSLQSVQNAWGLLTEKLEFLAVRANPPGKVEALDHSVSSKDAVSTYVPPEEAFLHRLLETGATESSSGSNDTVLAELTLKSSRATTRKSVEHLVRAIDTQRAKREELFQAFKHELPNDEVGQQMKKIHDNLREVVVSLRLSMDALHLKHKDLASQVHLWRKNTARDQAEIKLLTGELQETILDLENTRQKIAALRNKKDVVPGKPISLAGEVGDRTKEKPFQATKGLEGAVEEAKSLVSQRLNEIEEAEREKVRLTEQLHQVQELLNDEQYVTASHLYAMLTEQVEVLKKELERYQSLLDNLGAERDDASRCDKDASLKAEASEAVEKGNLISNDKIVQLESKLHNCITERNSLRVRLDETFHALERQDEVAEFKVMVSTLEKEMCMMQQQLDKYKEATCRAESLRAEVESTSLLLDKKTSECKLYLNKLADQAAEVKSLQDEARLLSESEQELKLILDMHGSESTDSRDIMELKEAERSAWAEVEKFKSALDDHGLELRVKVANEAEAACQQRLATAEAEISEFRQRLDASERVVIEFNEAAKMKSEEHDAYLAEIETIGQAYEDMQTQNQRLLQQISKRDDYNIKLVSESVKAKQLHTSLSEENQALVNCIQHATSLGESHKQRVARLEQQVKLHLDQLGKAIEDGRQNASAVEVLKRRAAEAEKERLSTKTSLEASQKELEQRKLKTGDIQEQLEKERMARKRVQDDLASLSCKMARNDVQYEGSSLIEKLQDEVKEYKAILKCSVCHDRQKEVVITKCYHLFCSPCIQRNLEIRHRKCPGCGVTFGQNDVRNVYI